MTSAPHRTRQFIGGVTVGYVHTVVVVAVGLWLTPYVLHHLGQREYGLWLLGAQLLTYLALVDLGVVALLPREVAYATGRGDGLMAEELPKVVAETARLVMCQMPAVAAACLACWVLLPADWPELKWPLVIVLVTFAATFPLRIFPAVLQGLQDLTFIGVTQMGSWITGTILTIAAVAAGFGLYSLAAGWVATQLLVSAIAAWRLLARFPCAWPSRRQRVSRSDLRVRFGKSVWISVSQVAQVLLNGTDLIVVGKLLGPDAVVPYVCTGKLVALLANQPRLFVEVAVPALSQIRADGSRQRLFQLTSGMTQGLLLGSGAVVCVTLAINRSFVSWWVGETRFAGLGLTLLFLIGMLLRHWNITAIYSLFCFGYERRIALTSVADGLVSTIAMLVLVPWMGLKGAVLGSLMGAVAISLPSNLRAVAREEQLSFVASQQLLWPWLARFVSLFGAIAALALVWTPHGPWAFAATAVIVGVIYVTIMLPVIFGPVLGGLVTQRLRPVLAYVPGLSRLLATEIVP